MIGKKLRGEIHINHIFKKTLIPQNMWNFKTLKNKQKLFKINRKFIVFKILLPHINVHDMLRKVVIYYTRKHKNVKNKILVMI